jgi:hypothetical protein
MGGARSTYEYNEKHAKFQLEKANKRKNFEYRIEYYEENRLKRHRFLTCSWDMPDKNLSRNKGYLEDFVVLISPSGEVP